MTKRNKMDLYKINISNELNIIIEKEEWDKGLELIKANQKKFKNDHWLLAQEGIMLYEKREYKKALNVVNKAFELEPTCPLVNSYKAAILRMLDRELEAIEIWQSLLSKDINQLAYGECGEGMKHTLGMLNDARYMIAISYFDLNKFKLAKQYIEEHLKYRKKVRKAIILKKKQ